jgi:hypothetical protein
MIQTKNQQMIMMAVVVMALIFPSFLHADNSRPSSPVKLIFIHHSCGENWLADTDDPNTAYGGGLGAALQDSNYFVSDTNYGWGPDGIGDNTDIGYWYNWFVGPDSRTYLTALFNENGQHPQFSSGFSRMANDPGGENEVIMFKSCFPNSNLRGNPNDPPTTGENPLRGSSSESEDHTVGNAKGIYKDLLTAFVQYPYKLFIVVTAPPLIDAETDSAAAANARAFNNWLADQWLSGYPLHNVAVFDFFNVLTSNGGNPDINDEGHESGNHHRIWNGMVQHVTSVNRNTAAYPSDDSHPNGAGNRKATAEFVSLLNYYYHQWKTGGTCLSVNDNLNFNMCFAYQGNQYRFLLNYCSVCGPGEFDWEMDPASFIQSTEDGSPCFLLSENLDFDVCAEYLGQKYGFTLKYVNGLKWRLDTLTFREMR